LNLLLLFPEDFLTETRVRVVGRRRDEIARIGGDELRVGVINGRCGIGKIVAPGELEVHLDCDPPPPLPLTLILALPRPKVLNRVIAGAASMGIKRIFLINAWRVEKAYWKSPRLSSDNIRLQCILGLEQARDTVMPQVEVRRFFRPFVEEELPVIARDTMALVAHPGAATECPRDVKRAVTLVVGPEGGWIAEEIASLERAGFEAVSFGPRILRVETAIPALVGRLAPLVDQTRH
jgi:16S rRNA (uracil1498-N3)-methyltransferase